MTFAVGNNLNALPRSNVGQVNIELKKNRCIIYNSFAKKIIDMKTNVSNRKTTIILTLILLAVIEAVSLPFRGWDPGFAIGAALGGSAAVANYFIMAFTTERMAETGKRGIFFLGFLSRLVIYGAAFYLAAVRISLYAGLACALGFLTSIVAVLILNGLVPIIRNRSEKARSGADVPAYEEPETDDEGNRKFVFVKDYSTVRYSDGKAYVTHKRFKKLKPRGEAKQQEN